MKYLLSCLTEQFNYLYLMASFHGFTKTYVTLNDLDAARGTLKDFFYDIINFVLFFYLFAGFYIVIHLLGAIIDEKHKAKTKYQ